MHRVHCSITIVGSGGPEACQREPQNLEVRPVLSEGGDVLGRNLSWICVTKGLEYFVRSRWGEDGGGPWTFVLKVTSSLKLDLTGEFEFVLVLSARLIAANLGAGSLGI